MWSNYIWWCLIILCLKTNSITLKCFFKEMMQELQYCTVRHSHLCISLTRVTHLNIIYHSNLLSQVDGYLHKLSQFWRSKHRRKRFHMPDSTQRLICKACHEPNCCETSTETWSLQCADTSGLLSDERMLLLLHCAQLQAPFFRFLWGAVRPAGKRGLAEMAERKTHGAGNAIFDFEVSQGRNKRSHRKHATSRRSG